jgi:hypothetical protein
LLHSLPRRRLELCAGGLLRLRSQWLPRLDLLGHTRLDHHEHWRMLPTSALLPKLNDNLRVACGIPFTQNVNGIPMLNPKMSGVLGLLLAAVFLIAAVSKLRAQNAFRAVLRN